MEVEVCGVVGVRKGLLGYICAVREDSPCRLLAATTTSEPSKRTLPMTDSSASAQYRRWLK